MPMTLSFELQLVESDVSIGLGTNIYKDIRCMFNNK